MVPYNENDASSKKGRIGEAFVDAFLRSDLAPGGAWYRYVPPVEDGRHPVDRLYLRRDTLRLMIADAKAYQRRSAYYDTGINASAFAEYRRLYLATGIDIFIFFVDDSEGLVYGNRLFTVLEERRCSYRDNGRILSYPLWLDCSTGRKRMWSLWDMEVITSIDDPTRAKLRNLRRSEYIGDVRAKTPTQYRLLGPGL